MEYWQKMMESYHAVLAEVYTEAGSLQVEIWMRALHQHCSIWAYRIGDKDMPVKCFIIFKDGTVRRDEHHNICHQGDK